MRRAPENKMLEAHARHLIRIVMATPWLFLDEIADELQKRCGGVRYLPGLCYKTLRHRGYCRGALDPSPIQPPISIFKVAPSKKTLNF